MLKYKVRNSQYGTHAQAGYAGKIKELAVVDWTDQEIASTSALTLAQIRPPFAIFPVEGDPHRERTARKFAYALAEALQAYDDKIAALEVTL